MSGKIRNPFQSTPERGTGLKTGSAGEQREGQPRTEEERKEHHAGKEIKDDSATIGSSDFVKLERNGKMEYRRKGYEDVELPAPEPLKRKSIKEQWAEKKAKK